MLGDLLGADLDVERRPVRRPCGLPRHDLGHEQLGTAIVARLDPAVDDHDGVGHQMGLGRVVDGREHGRLDAAGQILEHQPGHAPATLGHDLPHLTDERHNADLGRVGQAREARDVVARDTRELLA